MKEEKSTFEKLITQCSMEIDNYIIRSAKLSKKIQEHEFIIDIFANKVEGNDEINEFIEKYRRELNEYMLEYQWLKRELENARNIIGKLANFDMKGE